MSKPRLLRTSGPYWRDTASWLWWRLTRRRTQAPCDCGRAAHDIYGTSYTQDGRRSSERWYCRKCRAMWEIQIDTFALCPRWGDLGHNWTIIKGWLPWRRYRICCACGYEERIQKADSAVWEPPLPCNEWCDHRLGDHHEKTCRLYFGRRDGAPLSPRREP